LKSDTLFARAVAQRSAVRLSDPLVWVGVLGRGLLGDHFVGTAESRARNRSPLKIDFRVRDTFEASRRPNHESYRVKSWCSGSACSRRPSGAPRLWSNSTSSIFPPEKTVEIETERHVNCIFCLPKGRISRGEVPTTWSETISIDWIRCIGREGERALDGHRPLQSVIFTRDRM